MIGAGFGSRIALVCVGVALGLLSLPPGPLPPAVLVADLPFLLLLFHDGGRRWKRWALVYGMAHFALTLRWLGEVHWLEVPASAVVLGPVYVLLGAAIRGLVRLRVPFVAGVGVAVVLEEMLRTVWMGGMPWPMRSLAFASDAPAGAALAGLVPAAGLVGAYAFTFVAGSTAALLLGAWAWTRAAGDARRTRRRAVLLSAPVPLLAVLVLGLYGAHVRSGHAARRASGQVFESQGEFLAIQAAIPQDLKNAAGTSMQELFDRHVELSTAAVAAAAGEPLDGLLWPETMVSWPWLAPGLEARHPPAWRDEIAVVRRLQRDVVGGRDLHVFLGALSRHPAADGRARGSLSELPERDSLVHVRPARLPPPGQPLPRPPGPDPDARPPWAGPVARHDKERLVPGGEYTPLGDVVPALKRIRDLVSSIPELQAGGPDQQPFHVQVGPPWIAGERPPGHADLRVGSVICFDLAFPEVCRAWRRKGAEVLLNPANYGWFGASDFREQVTAMARLRAAEVGATVVMAGNTGPSLFVDPLGRLYGRFVPAGHPDQPLSVGTRASTFVTGWAAGRLVTDPRVPPYVALGDLPWAAAAVLLLAIGLLRRRVRIT